MSNFFGYGDIGIIKDNELVTVCSGGFVYSNKTKVDRRTFYSATQEHKIHGSNNAIYSRAATVSLKVSLIENDLLKLMLGDGTFLKPKAKHSFAFSGVMLHYAGKVIINAPEVVIESLSPLQVSNALDIILRIVAKPEIRIIGGN